MDKKYRDFLFFIEDSNDFIALKEKCISQRKAWEHEEELAENAKNQKKEGK